MDGVNHNPNPNPAPGLNPEMLGVYYKPLKPPKFDRFDVDSWLYAFENATQNDNEKMRESKLISTLCGEDLAWFRSIKENENPPTTFADWKTKFLEEYTDKPSVALHKLATRQQFESETSDKYCRDILALCKRVNATMSTEEKLHHLRNGLLDKYKQAMLYMRPADEKEFQDNLKDLHNNGHIVSKNTELTQITEALTTIAQQIKKPEPTFVSEGNTSNGQHRLKCQICNKKGHDAKTCYQFIGRQGRNTRNPQTTNPESFQQRIIQPGNSTHGNYNTTPRSQVSCQYCHKPGHEADRCFKIIGYPSNRGGCRNTGGYQKTGNHQNTRRYSVDEHTSHPNGGERL